jgi:tetratricopeptide (TPR) repeat protein
MSLRLLIAGSLVLLALPITAQQQDNSAPPPQQNTPAQSGSSTQKKDQPKKSTAQENPFPEAQSEAAAHQTQRQTSGSQPDAPQPQTAPSGGSQGKPSTSDHNPFPEAQSEKAAHQDQPNNSPALPAKPASPDDGSFSSSHVKGLDMPDTASGNPSDADKAAAAEATLPYNPKLARKDAGVGDFYLESGDYRGAYDRFLEANRSDPGNAEAVFGLAESARHLDRTDEAVRNYRLYLSALPYGPHAKEVRKALKEMGAAPAS